MNTQKTDDIFLETEGPPPSITHPEPETTRFVDVHIYTLEHDDENETRTIEATLDQISKANHPLDDDDEQPTQPQPGRQLSPCVSFLVGIVLLALLGKGYLLYLVPLMTPTTTITIVPISKQVQVTVSIQVVTKTPQAGQIAGRELSSITLSQTQTVATTGTAHQEATAARGTITFYNAAPTLQTIAAGTIITGANGIQIVTNQDAIIPAAVYPAFGQATVAAQTVLIGTAANSHAGTIYGPCCRLNISAVSSAFTGGQDGHDYRTVNPQDITTSTTNLKTSLATSTRAALQTQVQNGESLLTPFACASQVSSDRQPGDEATQVTVTMSETCHALAYHPAALHAAILQAINQQAARVGGSYTPTSDLAFSIKGAQLSDQGTATMQVVGIQTYSYQFSQQEQQRMKDRIAGKRKEDATALLLHTPGVQTVSISGSDPGMSSIPTDTSHIDMLFLLGS